MAGKTYYIEARTVYPDISVNLYDLIELVEEHERLLNMKHTRMQEEIMHLLRQDEPKLVEAMCKTTDLMADILTTYRPLLEIYRLGERKGEHLDHCGLEEKKDRAYNIVKEILNLMGAENIESRINLLNNIMEGRGERIAQ